MGGVTHSWVPLHARGMHGVMSAGRHEALTLLQRPSGDRRIGQNDLVSHLRSQFEAHADTRSFTFLNESGRDLVAEVATFRELDRNAREIAAWLSSRPEAKRPVLLLFEPGIDFWRAFLGCLYAGVIAVPTPLPHR